MRGTVIAGSEVRKVKYAQFVSIAEKEIKGLPFLSIYGKGGVIRIPRSAIVLFGRPRNVCFMIDHDYESIALMPCVEKHPMSTRVPENLFTDRKNVCVRYHCKGFVEDLLFMNELEEDKAYLVFGNFDPVRQRIIYRMATAIDAVSLAALGEGEDQTAVQTVQVPTV